MQNKALIFFLILSFLNSEAMEKDLPLISMKNGNQQSMQPWYQDNTPDRFILDDTLRSMSIDCHLSEGEMYQLHCQSQMFAQLILEGYKKIAINIDIVAQIHGLASVKYLLERGGLRNTFPDRQSQQTLNKLMYVLYTSEGYPKSFLTSHEKYLVARAVTDHLKIISPNRYSSIIKDFSRVENIGFSQVIGEDSFFSLPGLCARGRKILEYCGLLKGYFAAVSPQQSAESLKDKILNNQDIQDFERMHNFCLKYDFVEAKKMIDYYGKQLPSNVYFDKYGILCEIYNSKMQEYCKTILQDEFNIHECSPVLIDLIQKTIFCTQPQEMAEILYSTFAEHSNDKQLLNCAGCFFDERGLPRNFIYNEKLLEGLTFPKMLDAEQLKDRLLFFSLATRNTRSWQEHKVFRNCLEYLAQSFSATEVNFGYSDLAHAFCWVQENSKLIDTNISECDNFSLAQPYLQGSAIERRVVPLAANLMNEIKNNISVGVPKEQTQKFQEQLMQLDAYA